MAHGLIQVQGQVYRTGIVTDTAATTYTDTDNTAIGTVTFSDTDGGRRKSHEHAGRDLVCVRVPIRLLVLGKAVEKPLRDHVLRSE